MSDKDNGRKSQGDMSPAEMSMRKFLKQLGVTTHQELEVALAKAVAAGKISPGGTINIKADLRIEALDFNHSVSAELMAPDAQD